MAKVYYSFYVCDYTYLCIYSIYYKQNSIFFYNALFKGLQLSNSIPRVDIVLDTMQHNLDLLFHAYPIPLGYNPEYGTAGFRSNANNLDAVVFRCSVLMSIRAMTTGKSCGIMITASHNPECDNGVKLIDYNGEMIDTQWQQHATNLARAKSFDEFWTYIQRFTLQQVNAMVLIGTDTRESGYRLAYIASETIDACGIEPNYLGYVTTPELHFYTIQFNSKPTYDLLPYTQYLTDAFRNALIDNNTSCNNNITELHVDCANGVGAFKLRRMKQCLLEMGLRLVLYNTGNGQLNHECGADYVEKEHKFPTNMHDIQEYMRCCSLDGDADRIVYFTKINGHFEILNGDKIACLFVKYIKHISCDCSIGLVQTAYANGASTKYIRDNFKDVKVECTHTGVQHLHEAAHQFDVGVYFEANGHGTVLFKKEVPHYSHLSKLLSQVTGDAIGNMLVVEYILKTNTSFQEWINLYKDYYVKQDKIYTDKNAFDTADYGRVCIKPLGLQKQIDDIVAKYAYANARAFVRPSGTEDLVRLYVEGSQDTCLIDVVNKIKGVIAHMSI